MLHCFAPFQHLDWEALKLNEFMNRVRGPWHKSSLVENLLHTPMLMMPL